MKKWFARFKSAVTGHDVEAASAYQYLSANILIAHVLNGCAGGIVAVRDQT